MCIMPQIPCMSSDQIPNNLINKTTSSFNIASEHTRRTVQLVFIIYATCRFQYTNINATIQAQLPYLCTHHLLEYGRFKIMYQVVSTAGYLDSSNCVEHIWIKVTSGVKIHCWWVVFIAILQLILIKVLLNCVTCWYDSKAILIFSFVGILTTPGHHTTYSQAFLDAVHDSYLFQHVTTPTHYRLNTTANILDLVLTNEEAMINIIQYLPGIGSSDHVCL